MGQPMAQKSCNESLCLKTTSAREVSTSRAAFYTIRYISIHKASCDEFSAQLRERLQTAQTRLLQQEMR